MVLAEVEHLGLEHHRGDARGALERDVQLAHELVLRDRQIVVRDLTHRDLPELVERDIDRASHVLRIDAHAHDPR